MKKLLEKFRLKLIVAMILILATESSYATSMGAFTVSAAFNSADISTRSNSIIMSDSTCYGFTYVVDSLDINHLTFTASGTADEYLWTFDKNDTDSGAVADRTFLPGSHTVSLTYINASDSCTTTAVISVQDVDNQCALEYYFESPDSIRVIPILTGRAAYYTIRLNFGDGTVIYDSIPGTMHEAIYRHKYEAPGNYEICLTSNLSCNSCRPITIGDSTNCDASFDYQNLGGLEYQFRANDQDSSKNYSWLVDGEPSGSSSTFIYNFPSAGQYTVGLSLGDSTSSCATTQLINVQDSSLQCSFDYEYITNNLVKFTASDSSLTYIWDFGDSSRATTPIVYHEFPSDGTYNVCLTQTDSLESCIYCTNVIISPQDNDSLYIEGSLYADLLPVTSGTVELYQNDSITSRWTKIDEREVYQGAFRFNNLMPGRYLIYGRGAEEIYGPYVPTYFVNGISWRDADAINLTGAAEDIKITLIRSYQLSSPGAGSATGRLVDAEQESGDYVVILKDANANKILGWDLTNSGRDFHFGQLPFGKYRVVLERPSSSMSQTFELTAENPNVTDIELGPNLVSGVESQLNGVNVYPTEIKTHITLENRSYENKELSVKLRAITGTDFVNESVQIAPGETLEMKVSELPTGMYILFMSDQNGESKSYKLIKP
ncbi:PKD domain-containing protein [Fulvivirga ligni]|uniref:PKD domain-containing protein n=1 Tax=Fulvivirga ligni TaxID=2904246 RepID=UPI001F2A2350|nr:PKD domain-containing protein [Fulvivirga ligni]UII21387.1 PKD domain-containing protein [Fulvivirga ligni]